MIKMKHFESTFQPVLVYYFPLEKRGTSKGQQGKSLSNLWDFSVSIILKVSDLK